jgi:hypothetical protein
METTGGQILVSADGITSFADYISGQILRSQLCTKEADLCANRGLCSSNGVCQCYNKNGDAYGSSNGYGIAGPRGDCGYIVSGLTVSTCPGDIQCNGNGVCDPINYRCSCADGWTSGDCSLRTCPLGLSWYKFLLCIFTIITHCTMNVF